jgi:hypothetical protein
MAKRKKPNAKPKKRVLARSRVVARKPPKKARKTVSSKTAGTVKPRKPSRKSPTKPKRAVKTRKPAKRRLPVSGVPKRGSRVRRKPTRVSVRIPVKASRKRRAVKKPAARRAIKSPRKTHVSEAIKTFHTRRSHPNNRRLGIQDKTVTVRKTTLTHENNPRILSGEFTRLEYIKRFFANQWEGEGIYYLRLILAYDNQGRGGEWEESGFGLPREMIRTQEDFEKFVDALLFSASIAVENYMSQRDYGEKVEIRGADCEFLLNSQTS